MAKRYEIRLTNEPFFAAIAPLLHSNSGTTANLNSRINFYFVTCFYCFDNICISRHQGMKDMIFDKKTFLMTDLGLIL